MVYELGRRGSVVYLEWGVDQSWLRRILIIKTIKIAECRVQHDGRKRNCHIHNDARRDWLVELDAGSVHKKRSLPMPSEYDCAAVSSRKRCAVVKHKLWPNLLPNPHKGTVHLHLYMSNHSSAYLCLVRGEMERDTMLPVHFVSEYFQP